MEKGVGVWLRDADTEEWHAAVVVQLTAVTGDSAALHDVRVRWSEGPHARTEKTLRLDVHAIENEQVEHVMLANNHDMDLVEDLIQLPQLNEPGICRTLSERFNINEIYTLTGEILLAINPFKNVGIYSEKIMRKYIRNGDKRALGHEVAEMPPHVFSIADKAYRSLTGPLSSAGSRADQSILVSGESGAGKTESTKFVMEYLATISQHVAAATTGQGDNSVMKQVLSSNPILESFGNARTIRNDNSSRFGKFIKMHFSDRGNLIGASIQTYLLEKVRLAYQGESERNYHIFYEIIAGATAEEKERWKLMAPTKFHYLNQSTCTKRKDGVADADQFHILKNAMDVMGFSDEDKESIFVTISALLHLGNMEFDEVHEAGGTEGSTIAPDCRASTEVVQQYFEVEQSELEEALCARKIQAKDETYSISLLPDAAENSRDALARFLYGKLFDWLVGRINEMVQCEDNDTKFIGILDIFGFEDLEHNSFEQLCINYANETLQQHFNLTVLRLEQETYEREQIKWSFINFPDNSACIELIQGKPYGILTALDEECIVPQGNDRNFARKLYRQHESNAHFSAGKTEQANHLFVVNHYAGNVSYDTFGFCEKNKDILYSEITNIIKRSSKPFVRGLLDVASPGAAKAPKRGGRHNHGGKSILKNRGGNNASSRVSLGSQFRNQLKELLETIGATSCHYIRCLKPNDRAKADLFVAKRVCDQLKAGGVLEAVRVNRAGYPVRLVHQQFVKRYRPLANGSYLRKIPEGAGLDPEFDPEERKQASNLLVEFLLKAHAERYPELANLDFSNQAEAFAVAGIQVGLTRVFFRRSAIQFVEAQLAKRYGEFVVLIQTGARGLIARRRYQRMKAGSVIAQKYVRGFLARRKYQVLLRHYREKQARLKREREIAEREREIAEQKMAEEQRREAERERARERKLQEQKLLDEQRRIAEVQAQAAREASRSTTSDPVSDDDSSEGNNSSRKLSDPPMMTARQARGTSRFQFTRDYDPTRDSLFTMGDGPRSVAMDPGDTVLHVAANCCNEHDVLKLLQNGSDINAKNRRGRTPLHTASFYGNLEVVGILLDWEADVVVQDEDGNTPLHLTKDVHIARMLLEAGCTPNIVNGEGRTALIESVDRGDAPIVKVLLQFKADVLFRELKHHQTALHLAVRKGHYTIVMELCKTSDAKDLVLLTDRNDNNALHFSVARDRKNGYRLVDYLIKHGADINKVNARFQTPLVVHIMTTRQTDPAIAELLLSKGSDPNVSLADGSTLLHVAVERELIDVGCALIKHGANLNQPDAKGRMVVDVANKKYLKKLFSAITTPPTWIDDKERKMCMLCNSNFKFGSRRHHCRHCGRVCCSDCSSFTVEMFRFPKEFAGRVTNGGKNVKDPQRVCRTCHAVFKARTAEKESKNGFMARVLGYEWDEVTNP